MPGSSPVDRERVQGSDPGRNPPEARRQGLKLLVLLGPTGTGKTDTAIHVARRIGGEIVGCDAVQVYRGLEAATAKATAAQREEVPHHLIDVAEPGTDFSLADYIRAADEVIAAIAGRRKVPLVVGGTGLYLRGLLRGIVPAPPRDPRLRGRLRAMADRHGAPRLHRWLGSLDPDSAARLAPRDTQRIVRALEIALQGGDTWSERLAREGRWEDASERYDALKVGLDLAQGLLDERLRARVDRFFEAGLVPEVRDLLASGVSREANVFKAIGYREVLTALDAGEDPDGVREDVYRNTRRYAKRQRTWFRKERDVRWVDAAEGPETIAVRIADAWLDVAS